jgi:hypothetical protein
MVAVAGGTLLTFLYQEHSPAALRLSMGAGTGLALMATFGFALSAVLGLTPTSVALSAVIVLLPALLLARKEIRRRVLEESRCAWDQLRDRKARWFIGSYVALAIVLALVFAQNMVERQDGIYTRVQNNLGDLPFHLQVITGFVYGHNIPVEDPTYAGVRFTYPVLADFLTAMLVRAGASIPAAMWLQGMVLVLAFVGLLHHWTHALTRDRLAAWLSPILVIFSGGLGWWLLMQDLRLSDGGLITLLGHLPRDYTTMNSTIFRWGNSLTTLLLPERSFVFGLPLALFVFYQWWQVIESAAAGQEQQSGSRTFRRMLAAGIGAGLLPLIHSHGFVVVMGTGACLALLFRSLWRGWLVFLGVALLAGLPGVLWLSHGSAIDSRKFIGWQMGWDHAGYDPFWFWFVNTGFFVPLLLAAIFWRRSSYAVPRLLATFYIPFSFCFIIPNFLKLSPWIWDNIKFLFYWYVASAPLVAFFLARLWQERSKQRWISVGLIATLTLSGALDILRVITHAFESREFTPDGIQMAKLIAAVAPPRAPVLHAPEEWNSPVYLTGRPSLAGFSGWTWSRGLDGAQRAADINRMYSGGPGARALLKSYHVDYVLIGPQERALPVNSSFWTGCAKLAQIGEYELYKSDCGK